MGGEGEGKASGKTFQGGGPSLLVVSGQGRRLSITIVGERLACFFGQTVPGGLCVGSGCASPKYLQPAIVRSNLRTPKKYFRSDWILKRRTRYILFTQELAKDMEGVPGRATFKSIIHNP